MTVAKDERKIGNSKKKWQKKSAQQSIKHELENLSFSLRFVFFFIVKVVEAKD
jgi:hypothetical protein